MEEHVGDIEDPVNYSEDVTLSASSDLSSSSRDGSPETSRPGVIEAMSGPFSTGEMIHHTTEMIQAKDGLRHLSHTLWKRSIMFSARAAIFKLLNMLGSILVILIATSIGAYEALQDDKNVPVIVTSFFIAALKTVYQYLGIGKKGIYYKGVSLRLKGMSIDAVHGTRRLHTTEEIEDLTNILRGQMDKLDMDSYKVEYQGEVKYNQETGDLEVIEPTVPPITHDLENPTQNGKKLRS